MERAGVARGLVSPVPSVVVVDVDVVVVVGWSLVCCCGGLCRCLACVLIALLVLLIPTCPHILEEASAGFVPDGLLGDISCRRYARGTLWSSWGL